MGYPVAMPRPRDPELRDRLVHAATEMFARHGFAGASLDAIAHLAGVTKGGLYFHFAGKEELFFAVLDHWQQQRRQQVASQVAAGPVDAAEALRGLLRAYLTFHFDAPETAQLLRVLSTEMRARFTARLREDERQEQRWLRSTMRELLVAGNRDGSLFAEDPAEAAFVLASAVLGAVDQWYAAASDVEAFCDQERLARSLAGRYATGTRADAPLPSVDFDFRERAGTDS